MSAQLQARPEHEDRQNEREGAAEPADPKQHHCTIEREHGVQGNLQVAINDSRHDQKSEGNDSSADNESWRAQKKKRNDAAH